INYEIPRTQYTHRPLRQSFLAALMFLRASAASFATECQPRTTVLSVATRASKAAAARFSAIPPRANAHQNRTPLLESPSPASSTSWDFLLWRCASASAASPRTRGRSDLFLTTFSSARMVLGEDSNCIA